MQYDTLLCAFKITDMNWKILTGTAKEVETELNRLDGKYFLIVVAMSTTNEQTTLCVQLSGDK